ncbi:putative repeat protein (TIGR03806 family) [Pseudomonas sp. BIGb0408]|uniref:Putative repeat protein (TIGR03806 family) n=1 Tax=Phytopseudomonas flavescens TaxID=29435 RepID=A0A7Z0BPM9_9GAMM|nr:MULTISPECIES: c-type cytochrome [Pseudomonas]MCW2293138.1 putative repeat protein (TIGR03806 family) [Pseudomonas sp. BIGb0408]NYH72291.1 putative repeat protein (TIGR03806 family) [Pseudomonas flavescens]
MGRTVAVLITVIILSSAIQLSGCGTDSNQGDSSAFKPRLSEYGFFKGKMSELVPVDEASIIEIASPLFTDHAEKQRLLLLPKGEKMKGKGNDLPDFPDGTVIVKTFFYPRSSKGNIVSQLIVETRLLIKSQSKWSAATYKWNDTQDEAFLLQDSATVPIAFIDEKGHGRTINYRVPSRDDCLACHRQGNQLVPLGMKLRNMNIDAHRDEVLINQLEHLQSSQKLDAISPGAITRTPDYRAESTSLEDRARAYLDANCAHCHRPKGTARFTRLDLTYEETADRESTHLKRQEIARRITTSGPLHMPQIGTTISHEEGVQLIVEYLNDLDKKIKD